MEAVIVKKVTVTAENIVSGAGRRTELAISDIVGCDGTSNINGKNKSVISYSRRDVRRKWLGGTSCSVWRWY